MTKSKRRILTAALLGGIAFLACSFALQGSLITRLMNHYEVTESLGGISSAATSIGGFIALFLSLLLMGRLTKLTLLKMSIGVCALFFGMLPFAAEYAVFVLFWGVIGICLGYLDTLLSSCLADWYKGPETKRMMCILHLTYGLAYTIAPIVYALVLSHLDRRSILWNRIYLLLAMFGILLVAYLFFAAKGVKEQADDSREEENSRLSIALVSDTIRMKNGFCLKLMLAMLCHGVFYGGMSTWINRYVGQTLQSDLGDIALTFLFFGVMLSRLIMSFAKLSPETYVRIAGFGAGAVMFVVLFSGNPLLLCIGICLGGIMFGALIPCILTIGTSFIKSNSLLVTTLLLLCLYLGQAIGAPVVGILENRVNLHAGIGICIVFIVLSSVCCLFTRSTGEK